MYSLACLIAAFAIGIIFGIVGSNLLDAYTMDIEIRRAMEQMKEFEIKEMENDDDNS